MNLKNLLKKDVKEKNLSVVVSVHKNNSEGLIECCSIYSKLPKSVEYAIYIPKECEKPILLLANNPKEELDEIKIVLEGINTND